MSIPEISTKHPVVRMEMQKMVEEKDVSAMPMLKLQRRGYVNLSEKQFTMLTPSPSESQEQELAQYEYGPLEDDEIRVIILEEANFTDEIVIRLQVRKRTIIAPYEAVSYAWGSKDVQATGTIRVRTQSSTTKTLEVRCNVVTMLRQLRERQPLQPLWIDAICINQGLNAEKAKQVLKMADVYGRASQTLVWLGQSEEQLLLNLNQVWLRPDDLDMLQRHVEPLLRNDYFTRRWIIQELFFSRKVCLLDRYRELDFRVLEEASKFILKHVHHLHHLQDNDKERRLLNALHLMHILQELRAQSAVVANDHDHMRLLVSAHSSECHDGLDRLYALGALEKEERAVDYDKSVEELFTKFAKKELERSLETLYCCGAFPDTGAQPDTKAHAVGLAPKFTKSHVLPSWVPDWRSTRVWIPISLMHKRDVSETSFAPSLRDLKDRRQPLCRMESTTLVVHGAVIGTVSHTKSLATIGGLLEFYKNPEGLPGSSSGSETPEDVTRLVKTLTLDSVQDGRIAKPWLDVYRKSNGKKCPLDRHSSKCNHLDSTSMYQCNTLRRIEDVMNGRCAFVTGEGHWAVGPYQSRRGDVVVRLDGCRFPFVMRRQVCEVHFLMRCSHC
ncbi:hypothetical protein N0V95_009744 [Ascochyta clinopodiicola]|nr:hypothetical protein N0V95_009744 [Ascochyta clinopodiicola]